MDSECKHDATTTPLPLQNFRHCPANLKVCTGKCKVKLDNGDCGPAKARDVNFKAFLSQLGHAHNLSIAVISEVAAKASP